MSPSSVRATNSFAIPTLGPAEAGRLQSEMAFLTVASGELTVYQPGPPSANALDATDSAATIAKNVAMANFFIRNYLRLVR